MTTTTRRQHGWTDYQERMARVVSYVHDHLADELSLERLAEVAHLSPYHWHRVYHALYGETIAATVRRLRLHRGSGLLANSALPVADVARRCGYPNAQSFGRAFRQLYGMNPAQYRAHGGHVAFTRGGPGPEATGHSVEVRTLAAVTVAGAAHRGSYMAIGKAFETAYTRLAAHGLASPRARWIAAYLDDPDAVPESQLASRAGLSLEGDAALPPPIERFTVGGGPCAVLRHRGPYSTMRAAYRWLYGVWLVQSGRLPADQPVWEEYVNHPRDVAPADLLTDICLPLAE